jgi:hypothetical protein
MKDQWEKCLNLIIVPAHAIYCGSGFQDPASDSHWILQDFQKGEPPFYIEHIRKGIELAGQDPLSLLIFSGGQTRLQAGPRSEAASYWLLACQLPGSQMAQADERMSTEEFARDSFENLLFGICRFRECTLNYPRRIVVVGWTFKEKRFSLHRQALHFPASRFEYAGINNPVALEQAERGEQEAISLFTADPFGVMQAPAHSTLAERSKYLGEKRQERNPFRRHIPYLTSCPEIKGLLSYRGTGPYEEPLPWG